MILDASWNASAYRLAAIRLADDTDADLCELNCVLDASKAAKRIASRQQRGDDSSDVTVEIAVAMASETDPWPSASIVDTSSTRSRSLALALRAIDGDPSDMNRTTVVDRRGGSRTAERHVH